MNILERLEEQNGKRARFTIAEANMILAKALKAERERVRRLVRKMVMERSAEYMRDAENPHKKNMKVVNVGRAWAFRDFCDDILSKLKEGR